MAIPSVVSSSSNGTTTPATNLTITLGAGLSYIALFCQKAVSLNTASGDINNVSSGWTCLVGTHGGSPYSGTPNYGIYLFQKVTTASETINSGAVGSGSKGYCAITLSGYDTGSPYEALATGTGSFSGGSPYTATLPAMTTTGADRLALWFAAPANFAAGSLTYTNGALASPSTTGFKTNVGLGDIFCAYGGKASAGSTGTTAAASTDIGFVGAGYPYALLAVKPTAAASSRVKVKSGGSFATDIPVKVKAGGSFADAALKVKSGGAFS